MHGRWLSCHHTDTQTCSSAEEQWQSRRNWDVGSGSVFRSKRSVVEHHVVQVIVVADRKMAAFHGGQLEAYIVSLMSIVTLIYKDRSLRNSVRISLVGVASLEEDLISDGVNHLNADISAAKLLNRFCTWQRSNSKNLTSGRYDVALHLTRESICGGKTMNCHKLGLAENRKICDRKSTCAIVEDGGLSTAFTIAHELGHLLGMQHDQAAVCRLDDQQQRQFLMSKTLGRYTYPWAWSECSRRHITEFLASGGGSCLKRTHRDNHLWQRAEIRLAGEKYDADEQCRLIHGDHFQLCSHSNGEPTCRHLWCAPLGSNDSCWTRHMPWADGTSCGNGSWCQRGDCVLKSQAARPVNGNWGDWQQWGECSRLCGGGIRRSIRRCSNPAPSNGGDFCLGRRIRYESCNTQQCSSDTPDFRSVQCAKFNGKNFGIQGVAPNVKWVPHHNSTIENRCKLMCRVFESSAFYKLKNKVIDGTKCAPEGDDVCVDGVCTPAGCDNIIYSNKHADLCGVCDGDNSTCMVVEGSFGVGDQSAAYGYSRVSRIPGGAMKFHVYQVSANSSRDDNYLVLKDPETNEYVLNGDFNVSMFQKILDFAGSVLEYSGAMAAVEAIMIRLPLAKDLELQVLSVGNRSPPNITYMYIVSVSNGSEYEWRLGSEWTVCDRMCQGKQSKHVKCVQRKDGVIVADTFCNSSYHPVQQEKYCHEHCTVSWAVIRRSKCSSNCGSGTLQNDVQCLMSENSARPEPVADEHCHHIRDKPPTVEPCHSECHSLRWRPGSWSSCSKNCKRGVKTREVVCVTHSGVTVDSRHCDNNEAHKKPSLRKRCRAKACAYKWQIGRWSKCHSCRRRRQVRCTAKGNVQVSRRHCKALNRPRSLRRCRSCLPASCKEVQKQLNLSKDGEYWLLIRKRKLKVYCHGLNTSHPSEFITLPDTNRYKHRNYANIDGKRLIQPSVCPYNGSRISRRKCNGCTAQETGFAGLTVFHRLRLNTSSLSIITADFTFTRQVHGQRVAYGEAGDCYSTAGCSQGRFSISLTGTGLRVSPTTTWRTTGIRADANITRNKDNTVIHGQCGGFCGICHPSTSGSIKLEFVNQPSRR